MGHWSIEEFEEHLVSLFVAKKIVKEIVAKVFSLSVSVKPDEQIAIGVEKNGKDIKVILKVFDETKPKCWVEGFQYKFNSYISEIITVIGKHERNY